MFYYLYEIKNLINGKIYVGVHKTDDLDDGYMGSGKVINAAIKKHGIENFKKVIFEQFDNSTAMYAREKETVTDEFLAREDIYNLRRGGNGGFDYINAHPEKFLTEKRLKSLMTAEERAKRWRKKYDSSEEFRLLVKENLRKASKISYAMHGSPFKKLNGDPLFQAKRKAKFAEIGHSQGEKNSQFGTMWITNDQENKKIKKTDSVPNGWRKGRLI